MMPVLRVELGVVLALVVVGAAAAQQPQQHESTPPRLSSPSQQPVPEQQPVANAGGYTLHTTSKLVELDVVVTDEAGRVMNELTQNDFEVLENREAQKIDSFERPAMRVPPTNVTSNSTYDLDRFALQAPVSIIVLDEFNSSF
jgi:hypothetical protein